MSCGSSWGKLRRRGKGFELLGSLPMAMGSLGVREMRGVGV